MRSSRSESGGDNADGAVTPGKGHSCEDAKGMTLNAVLESKRLPKYLLLIFKEAQANARQEHHLAREDGSGYLPVQAAWHRALHLILNGLADPRRLSEHRQLEAELLAAVMGQRQIMIRSRAFNLLPCCRCMLDCREHNLQYPWHEVTAANRACVEAANLSPQQRAVLAEAVASYRIQMKAVHREQEKLIGPLLEGYQAHRPKGWRQDATSVAFHALVRGSKCITEAEQKALWTLIDPMITELVGPKQYARLFARDTLAVPAIVPDLALVLGWVHDSVLQPHVVPPTLQPCTPEGTQRPQRKSARLHQRLLSPPPAPADHACTHAGSDNANISNAGMGSQQRRAGGADPGPLQAQPGAGRVDAQRLTLPSLEDLLQEWQPCPASPALQGPAGTGMAPVSGLRHAGVPGSPGTEGNLVHFNQQSGSATCGALMPIQELPLGGDQLQIPSQSWYTPSFMKDMPAGFEALVQELSQEDEVLLSCSGLDPKPMPVE